MVEKVREYIQKPYFKGFINGFLGFGLLFLLFMFVSSWGKSIGTGCPGTDSTVGAIGAYQQLASSEVADAGREIRNAGEAIGRASDGINGVQARIERSSGLAERNANLITYLRAEIKECRRLAGENQRILEELGTPAGSGTSQGKSR